MPWDVQRKNLYCNPAGTSYGIALGHGHAYQSDFTHQFPEISHWYLVDADEAAFPDFVCHVEDMEAMSSLPDSQWDVAISVYCPIYDTQEMFNAFLQNMKRILKPGGILYLPNEVWHIFLKMLDEKTRSGVENEIFFFLGWENIQRFIARNEIFSTDPFQYIVNGAYTAWNAIGFRSKRMDRKDGSTIFGKTIRV